MHKNHLLPTGSRETADVPNKNHQRSVPQPRWWLHKVFKEPKEPTHQDNLEVSKYESRDSDGDSIMHRQSSLEITVLRFGQNKFMVRTVELRLLILGELMRSENKEGEEQSSRQAPPQVVSQADRSVHEEQDQVDNDNDNEDNDDRVESDLAQGTSAVHLRQS